MWPFRRKRKRTYGGVSISEDKVDVVEALSWVAFFIVEITNDN